MSIGPTIRRLRNERELSIDQLSSELGISSTSLRLYETNVRKPKKAILDKIAEVLDVNPMIFSESNDSAHNATLTLINLFQQYGGKIYEYNDLLESSDPSIKDCYFWTFDRLPAFSFYNAYKKFQDEINRAQESNDPIIMAHQIINAEKEFHYFIDTFPLSLTDSEKKILEFSDISTEASIYMDTHPLNDSDYPENKKNAKRHYDNVRKIYNKFDF